MVALTKMQISFEFTLGCGLFWGLIVCDEHANGAQAIVIVEEFCAFENILLDCLDQSVKVTFSPSQKQSHFIWRPFLRFVPNGLKENNLTS